MKNLSEGILFEENGALLKWGKSLDTLGKTNHAKKEDKNGRTYYYWGTHSILNGLNLDLVSDYLHDKPWYFPRKFHSIQHIVIGDIEAKKSFSELAKHLTEHFGEPQKEENVEQDDILLLWQIDSVTIQLYFFEMHCYRVHLTIKKK